MVYVWFEVSFNFKNFAQRSSEVNSLVRFELLWLCQHIDWNLLSKSAFTRINTWMRFSNYAIQSQQIQVTFTFKKQNVRQTTYRNNSPNRWWTNPERYPESNKQHPNLFHKTTRVLFSFNNCTIQSQQIQSPNKGKEIDFNTCYTGSVTSMIFKNTQKIV